MSPTTAADSQSNKSKGEVIDPPITMSGPTPNDPVATWRDSRSPTPLSDTEAKYYYYGLPSGAPLVARTGSTRWEKPTGPQADWKRKRLGSATNHKISKIWDDLAPKVCRILDEGKVEWTSIDLFRIGYQDDPYVNPDPVVLWIGIRPDSQVSYKVHYNTAFRCKKLLTDHDIEDVEVEMRGSQVMLL